MIKWFLNQIKLDDDDDHVICFYCIAKKKYLIKWAVFFVIIWMGLIPFQPQIRFIFTLIYLGYDTKTIIDHGILVWFEELIKQKTLVGNLMILNFYKNKCII
jgi:hypothetical protein